MKQTNCMFFIIGLFLTGAGIYLSTNIRAVITSYQEVPPVTSGPAQGYFVQAISAQTQPCTVIGITMLILGVLFIVLSAVNRKQNHKIS